MNENNSRLSPCDNAVKPNIKSHLVSRHHLRSRRCASSQLFLATNLRRLKRKGLLFIFYAHVPPTVTCMSPSADTSINGDRLTWTRDFTTAFASMIVATQTANSEKRVHSPITIDLRFKLPPVVSRSTNIYR